MPHSHRFDPPYESLSDEKMSYEKSVQGFALVASPQLNDPHFFRTVVYILQHDEQGALGLVINRPLQQTIGELLDEMAALNIVNDARVHWGGPVDGPLMLLQELRRGDKAGVFAATEQSQIVAICTGVPLKSKYGDFIDEDASVRGRYLVFDGYAGWGPGQLDAELHQGGWLVWDVEPNDIFGDSDEVWQRALRGIGREILAVGIDVSRLPEDPAFN